MFRYHFLKAVTNKIHFFLKKIHTCVCCMCVGAHRLQKQALDLLVPELWRAWSCLTWILGTKLRSSKRAESTLNLWEISTVHHFPNKRFLNSMSNFFNSFKIVIIFMNILRLHWLSRKELNFWKIGLNFRGDSGIQIKRDRNGILRIEDEIGIKVENRNNKWL